MEEKYTVTYICKSPEVQEECVKSSELLRKKKQLRQLLGFLCGRVLKALTA